MEKDMMQLLSQIIRQSRLVIWLLGSPYGVEFVLIHAPARVTAPESSKRV
jgi:hypothetical protein